MEPWKFPGNLSWNENGEINQIKVGSKSFCLGTTTKNQLVLVSRVFETAYDPLVQIIDFFVKPHNKPELKSMFTVFRQKLSCHVGDANITNAIFSWVLWFLNFL